jgi:hypothetical protein
MTENCRFCPMNFGLRKEILQGMSDTLTQASDTFRGSQQADSLTLTTTEIPSSESVGQELKSNEPSLRKTAWMELNIFAPQDQTSTTTQQAAPPKNQLTVTGKQKELINYIINSKLDTLWISICPNCYYSPIASQKHNEKKMLDSISNFTAQLKGVSQKKNITLPKILIGFEITNNLCNGSVPNSVPKIFAQDVYGNSYQDVPDPLNDDFWQNEVETPFAKFVEQWNKPEIGNGIAISGIMVDLEMYGRKSGIFLTTMGITQSNLSEFFNEQQVKPGPMTLSGSINYLMNNKLSQKYFEFLEGKAKKLGTRLKDSFDKQVPGCAIALYMPNLLASWFYKGLYQGLNKPAQPLYLFSFNAEFNYHKNWFTQNNINAHHSSVLLLSKISNTESFKLTKDVLDRHNGVWLNRFSRLIEPRSNDWTAVEKPTFPESMRQKMTSDFVDYLGKI